MTAIPPPSPDGPGYRSMLWLLLAVVLVILACGTCLGWVGHDAALPDMR